MEAPWEEDDEPVLVLRLRGDLVLEALALPGMRAVGFCVWRDGKVLAAWSFAPRTPTLVRSLSWCAISRESIEQSAVARRRAAGGTNVVEEAADGAPA